MTASPPEPASGGAGARAQRRLRGLMAVGGVLVVVGLAATLVLVGEFLLDLPTPGTWAYGVAMLAPLGFALLLVGLLGVAVARRRDAVGGGGSPSS